MWRSKKFIVAAVLSALVVVGSIAGVALAQTGSAGAATDNNTLMARVAQILGIDQTKLQNAFNQARQEQRDQALDKYLQGLVSQNKITQAQADQYKAWVKSKPDVSGIGPGQNFGMRPFAGGRRGMMRGWNFKGVPPAPAPPATAS